MKILLGVTAALAVTACLTGWQLRVAWSDVAEAKQEAAQAHRLVEQQRQQAELLAGRLDALDRSLSGLTVGLGANARQLEQTLAAIDGITKTEGDTDESIACLDVRVPRQLDDSLH